MQATGTQSDTQPTAVFAAMEVQLNLSQWLTDASARTEAAQLHAFRGYGTPGSCLQMDAAGTGVEVGTCDNKASMTPAQRFLVPLRVTGQPMTIETTTGLCATVKI